jgi:nucleoside-diphosphate-sugar epimerase
MRKVLVTGSAGFVGHHLCRYLKKKGYWVRGVDIEPEEWKSNVNEFYLMDLKDPLNCEEVVRDIDWVYNLAAMNGSIEMTTTNKAELVHNNALVNLNMAESCADSDTVERVFYSSSACVYPIHYQETDDTHLLKEEDAYPSNPDSEYGWEKLFSERVWQSYMEDRGLEVRIARFINIYGTECLIDTLRSKAPMALTRKVIEAGDGGDVYVWGDGGQKRTFCWIDDLLVGIEMLMESDIREPLNLGSDYLVSINELVDIIAEIEGVKINKIHQLDKVQGVRVRMPDLTKTRTLLGWDNKMELKEGMKRVNEYVKKELGK